ncbi:T9SS type A sorting domain-containing protein [Bacteroidota bacterium]
MKIITKKLTLSIILSLFLSLAIITPDNNSLAQSWRKMSAGVNNSVFAITTYYNKIIVGGAFLLAGGQSASRIAKWNGTSWDTLGSGTNGTVFAMTVYNNKLIVAGDFTTAGGQTANRIAMWDGSNWSNIGLGANDLIYALTVYNGKLVVGGNFTSIGGISASRLAMWDGNAWSTIGLGTDDDVRALTVYNGDLIVGGSFLSIGGASINKIARWNGVNWFPIDNGLDNGSVYALIVYNNHLMAGGSFTSVSGVNARRVAGWNGTNWYSLGPYGVNNNVLTFTKLFNDLIVGGIFLLAGNSPMKRIAKWNGSAWSPLGNGTDNIVYAVHAYDGVLTAGGSFNTAGDSLVYKVAQWGAVPQIPVLVSPLPGTTGTSLTPMLDWQNTLYAVDYRLKLASDPNFVNLIVDQLGITQSQFQVPSGLLNGGSTYFWRVWARNGLGNSAYSLIWYFTPVITNLSNNGGNIPTEYKLYNNFPNPFNPTTKIKFDIVEQTNVKLIVFDMLGREVETLVNTLLTPGSYEYEFTGKNLTSGIYFYRIVTDNFADTKKMILMK